MRKIISGLLGVVMTASVVGGVAYAAFSSTASVEGISISAGTASLLVWNGTSYVTTWENSGWTFPNLFPGGNAATNSFWLKNDSSGPVELALTAKLRNGVSGDWNAFKDDVEVAITDFEVSANDEDYHSLSDWNLGNGTFASGSNDVLPTGTSSHYTMHVRVISTAGETLQGETLNGINFDFTGITPVPVTEP